MDAWYKAPKERNSMFNPSSSARSALYALQVFVNATVGVLVASKVEISVYVIALIAGFNAVMGLLAKANVTPDEQ